MDPASRGLMEDLKEPQTGYLQGCLMACFVTASAIKDVNILGFALKAISLESGLLKRLCEACLVRCEHCLSRQVWVLSKLVQIIDFPGGLSLLKKSTLSIELLPQPLS